MTPMIAAERRDGRVATWIATAGLAVLFLAGLWLIAAPFALDDQPRTGPWLTGTRNDLITGGILAVVSGLGLLIVTITAVRELYRRGGHPIQIDGGPGPSPAPGVPPVPQSPQPPIPPAPATAENDHGHG